MKDDAHDKAIQPPSSKNDVDGKEEKGVEVSYVGVAMDSLIVAPNAILKVVVFIFVPFSRYLLTLLFFCKATLAPSLFLESMRTKCLLHNKFNQAVNNMEDDSEKSWLQGFRVALLHNEIDSEGTTQRYLSMIPVFDTSNDGLMQDLGEVCFGIDHIEQVSTRRILPVLASWNCKQLQNVTLEYMKDEHDEGDSFDSLSLLTDFLSQKPVQESITNLRLIGFQGNCMLHDLGECREN